MLSCKSSRPPLNCPKVVPRPSAEVSTTVCGSMRQAAVRRLSVLAASVINSQIASVCDSGVRRSLQSYAQCSSSPGNNTHNAVTSGSLTSSCSAPYEFQHLASFGTSSLHRDLARGSRAQFSTQAVSTSEKGANMAFQAASEPDISYLTQKEAAAIDEELMGPLGFSVDQLMELAGLSVACAIYEVYRPSEYRRVLVICGPGNNGGDGFVCARHLHHFGYAPTICYPKRTDKPLYKGLVTQLEALHAPFVDPESLSLPLTDHYDVIVDAMFGFSFKGIPRPPFDKIVKMLSVGPDTNPAETGVPPTVSIDIPSGWDVEKGDVETTGFHPPMLVSLTAPKLAAKFFHGPHHFLGGRFVPPAIVEKFHLRLPPFPGTSQCVRIGPAVLDVAAMRLSYEAGALDEEDAAKDPVEQFSRWFNDAVAANIHEPNGMSLATVSADGRPSNRFVLLKGYDADGFKWYTNYGSRKGSDLSETGRAALAFWWPGLERQVRIEGDVEKLPSEESDAYFHSRPKGSQIGAAASPQSSVVPSRSTLEDMYKQLEAEYQDKELPRPETWGGFRLRPQRIEFWQGRPSRLHDRLLLTEWASVHAIRWRVEDRTFGTIGLICAYRSVPVTCEHDGISLRVSIDSHQGRKHHVLNRTPSIFLSIVVLIGW
ncbi:putative pyridoxin (pyrodoxamine) 5'-phosphate oxidase [Klebsormidium nitens]|uniref:NAD(P)H-hydrate epimerase n=1 Tax=Klebsormidium nitens TaxID=105231 RepID=A0A1Y1IFQ8_KLENI|nr:putative pyridoxin (pyrodoxamine) 5'-phosphate oxidase [Klebsormidium nitens]|eukprot:GAQ89473.1 putative pyridoxin (pyrodoxamine) 5'-phosphate oxidase [Klebsormidium nitens]